MGMLIAAQIVFVAMPAWSQTAALPAGVEPCVPAEAPVGYGAFTVLKAARFSQAVGEDPVEVTTPGAAGASFTLSAPAGYAVSNGRVAGPSAFALTLGTQESGALSGTTNFPSEAALNSGVPAGSWLTQFLLGPTNGASYVAFFPFSLQSAAPPVPKVRNLEAARAVNPSAAFRVEWEPWTTATAGDRVAVVIRGPAGVREWELASDCDGAEGLTATAGAVEVPADTLAPGASYTVSVTFATQLHTSTDEATRLVKRGYQSRTTQFALLTTSSVAQEFGTISDVRLSDGRLYMVVSGTPRTNYWVQSTVNGTNWTNVLNVYLPISGKATVSVVAPTDGQPREYRAVLESSIAFPLEPASLALRVVNAGQMLITLTGTPGATYNIQWSSNWTTWQPLFFQGITLPRRPPGGINPPPGVSWGQINLGLPFARTPGLRVYRAVTVRGP